MGVPGFDIILGTNTMKELGIILNFWMKEIDIDYIIFPMRDIHFQIELRLSKHGWQTIVS
jgi:hypothetical protein